MKSVTENTAVTTVVDGVPAVRPGPGRPKTKVTLRRVVLADGKPVGRGRPVKGSKSNRTYVFVPVGESYDLTVHGVGSQYRPGRAQPPIKRVNISSFRKLVNVPATKPVQAVVEAPAVLVDTAAAVTVVGDKF